MPGKVPKMPKFALANGLWLGKLPARLKTLTDGAWIMLALARPFIRRYSCLNDSGKWMHPDERIRGFIDNVVASAQANGGRVLTSLP